MLKMIDKNKKVIVGGLKPAATVAFNRARVGLTTRVQRINGQWVWVEGKK